MKAYFFELAGQLERALQAGEVLLLGLDAERSDFVRFNRGRVRQAGSVEQRTLELRLVHAGRQGAAALELEDGAGDLERARDALGELRASLEGLRPDPWLAINETPASTDSARRGTLPAPDTVVEQVVGAAGGRDLVGIYAAGEIQRGFANSLGQRNWHAVDSFNFDWSLHSASGQAVKGAIAGFEWDRNALFGRLEAAARELALLEAPARTIAPGEYRVFLAPRAMEELVGLLAWDGFSGRARATKQSPLLRMEHGARLAPALTIAERSADGIAPPFQEDGFVKPPAVTLIERGQLGAALVSPRTAKEYGLEANGAEPGESPESLELAAGTLPAGEALAALDTGLYVNNLWYLNYSDRAAGRITGMTRFATFWVEQGRIVAPVGAMRFDDTLYRVLGENLEALTLERELLLDPSTYESRSTASALLPGALLRALRFTL
ncbi:MAG: metallopeptidase TldD-related protein [Burkholderiales bacterium]|nr:metallopeptidase TldD-related protein [Burkholderiales bacterium]